MRILFDQGTPVPLRDHLVRHDVRTVFEQGRSRLTNGELLTAAEQAGFEVLVTTDRNLRYQQNLTGRRVAVVVLTTTSWPRIRGAAVDVASVLDVISVGQYREIVIP